MNKRRRKDVAKRVEHIPISCQAGSLVYDLTATSSKWVAQNLYYEKGERRLTLGYVMDCFLHFFLCTKPTAPYDLPEVMCKVNGKYEKREGRWLMEHFWDDLDVWYPRDTFYFQDTHVTKLFLMYGWRYADEAAKRGREEKEKELQQQINKYEF